MGRQTRREGRLATPNAIDAEAIWPAFGRGRHLHGDAMAGDEELIWTEPVCKPRSRICGDPHGHHVEGHQKAASMHTPNATGANRNRQGVPLGRALVGTPHPGTSTASSSNTTKQNSSALRGSRVLNPSSSWTLDGLIVAAATAGQQSPCGRRPEDRFNVEL